MRISYLLAFSFDTPIADFEAATGISDLEVPADEGAAQDQPAGDPIDTSDADLREQLAAAMARIAVTRSLPPSASGRCAANAPARPNARITSSG